jgi:hypothetical protein
MRSRFVLVLSGILLACHAHAADVPAFHGAADCRIAPIKPAPRDNDISWEGPCKNGYADGRGTLTWRAQDNTKWKLEGTLARGAIAGEATRSSGEATYIGTFRNGVPHGTGYFRYADGDQYEGGVADGLHEGPGLFVQRDGSSYEGYWKQDRRHGYGKAVFSTGGSYVGEWRDDRFHGRGKIVYAGSRHSYEGEFVAGRVRGSAPLTIDKGQFPLKADLPSTGTNILATRAVSLLPLDATWQTLTEPQRNLVRSWYPALEEGDEPPYPLEGRRGFIKAIADVVERLTDHQGAVLLLVTVGADGTPETVKAIDARDAELGRYLAMVAMVQRFKPARCRGHPCAMIYPLRLVLERVN